MGRGEGRKRNKGRDQAAASSPSRQIKASDGHPWLKELVPAITPSQVAPVCLSGSAFLAWQFHRRGDSIFHHPPLFYAAP